MIELKINRTVNLRICIDDSIVIIHKNMINIYYREFVINSVYLKKISIIMLDSKYYRNIRNEI